MNRTILVLYHLRPKFLIGLIKCNGWLEGCLLRVFEIKPAPPTSSVPGAGVWGWVRRAIRVFRGTLKETLCTVCKSSKDMRFLVINLSQNAKLEFCQMLSTSENAYALVRWRLQPLLSNVAAILTAPRFPEACSAESLLGLKLVRALHFPGLCGRPLVEFPASSPLPFLSPRSLFLKPSSSVPSP